MQSHEIQQLHHVAQESKAKKKTKRVKASQQSTVIWDDKVAVNTATYDGTTSDIMALHMNHTKKKSLPQKKNSVKFAMRKQTQNMSINRDPKTKLLVF